MKKVIDISTWKRKEHYQFFKDYEEPFFGVTVNIDCTRAYKYAKDNKLSFFLYYMYQSLMAVNAVEEFRCRIEEGKVVCYDKIHCSTTALNVNNLFAFAFMPHTDSFEAFYEQAQKEIATIKSIEGMNINESSGRIDVIHYSTVPWFSFTGLTHERNFSRPDSIPKITFGKYFKEGDKLMLPVALNGHHGLMDGYHIGQHLEIFQQLLNKK